MIDLRMKKVTLDLSRALVCVWLLLLSPGAFAQEAAGEIAAAEFTRVHQDRALPTDIEARILAVSGPALLAQVLKRAGLVPSASEARRMIGQGAVEVDEQRVTSLEEVLSPGRSYLLRVGKRRFCRVTLVADGSEPA